MAKCPECETEVTIPIKTWAIQRTSKSGRKIVTVLGAFECQECGNRFRAGVKRGAEPGLSIKDVAQRIRGIEGNLLNTLKNLREKLKTLESERSSLLLEIDKLKKMAETKASALESEINLLKNEVRSLKQLLGMSEGNP